MFRYLFLLLFLSSCATFECAKVSDPFEKVRCEEREKINRYYDQAGWRYRQLR